MLPDIISVAEQHSLRLNHKTLNNKEVLCKCPFCKEDSKPTKKNRYYLSLNQEDNVFKCWYCKESGGVFRFISLLENQPEHAVISKYRKKNGIKKSYSPHPAEQLSSHQLRLMEFHSKPRWDLMYKRDKKYYYRTCKMVWESWQEYLAFQRYNAFKSLVVGIETGTYQKAIQEILTQEEKIGVSEGTLLNEVLKVYSMSQRPEWAEQGERFAKEITRSVKIKSVKVFQKTFASEVKWEAGHLLAK